MKRILLFLSIVFFLLLCSLSAVFFIKKDHIKNDIIQKLNKSLKVQVSIKSVDISFFDSFPNVSVVFSHLKIINKDNALPNLCGIKKLSCSFNVLDVLDNKVHFDEIYLKGGYINIFLDKKGSKNYDIFNDGNHSFTKNLSRLNLNNIQIVYEDKQKAVRYPISIKSLQLSKRILLNDSLQSLYICQSNFIVDSDGQSWLHPLEKKEIYTVFSVINKKGVANFEFENSAKIKIDTYPIHVKGNISFADSINSKISFKLLKEVPISMMKDYFSDPIEKYLPFFLNEEVKILGSGVIFGNISKNKIFRINIKKLNYKGKNGQFDGELKYISKKTRHLDVNFWGNCNFKMLSQLPEYKDLKKYFSIHKGTLSGKIKYSANLDMDTKDIVNSKKYNLNADIAIKGMNIKIPTLFFPLNNFEGNFQIDKNRIVVENSTFTYNKKNFNTKITVTKIQNWLMNNEKPKIAIDLTSDDIQKSDLLSSNVKNKNDGNNLNENKFLPDKNIWPFSLNLNLKTLSWDKYILKNLSSKIYVQTNQIDIKNTSFNYAGGKVILNSSLKTHPKDHRYTKFNLGLNSKDVSISQLFYTSDNFGQAFIQDKHLKGNLSAASNIVGIINPKGNVINKSIKGYIDFTINDGYLIDFKPILTLSKYLSKGDFKKIKFGQITDRIDINKEEVIIPKILVKNSVRNFEMSGIHGFNQAINYRLKVPIRANEKLSHIDNSSKTIRGLSLYFNIIGTSDDYEVILEKRKIKGEIKKVFAKEKQEWDDRKLMGGKDSKASIRVNKKKKRIE